MKNQIKSESYDEASGRDTASRARELNALGRRICKIADLYKNRKSAADAAGISTDQLARYIRGENQPGLLAMAAMSGPHGISLEWLANGTGEMTGNRVDTDLLTVILDTIEQALERHQLKLLPEKKSRLIALLYSLYEQGNQDSIKMDNVVRLIDYGK